MNTEIKHEPIFDTSIIIKLYSAKDGVPIKYVCSTALNDGNQKADIFYRETPHPVFGNKYFGIVSSLEYDDIYIIDADKVERLEFGLVEGDDNKLHYSSYRWDFKQFNNGNMIDGGRAYARYSGKIKYYKVSNGEMLEYRKEQ